MVNRIFISVLFIGFACGSLGVEGFIPKAYAENIPDDIAIRILVNEAGNQGLKGMICVGEVLRHRGHTKGFHRSDFVGHPTLATIKLAQKAWQESAHTNYTNGADHFANIRGGKPWWVRHCVETYEYKDHVFYKEVRHKKL